MRTKKTTNNRQAPVSRGFCFTEEPMHTYESLLKDFRALGIRETGTR